jgi:hypothetical protein
MSLAGRIQKFPTETAGVAEVCDAVQLVRAGIFCV